MHALCGENGAGKSTLMKILYGMQRPDEGTIRVDGAEVTFRSPADAIRAGIGMVHQHFMLADNLTVAENVLLGAEASHGIGARARARIGELARVVGLRTEPACCWSAWVWRTGSAWRSSRCSTGARAP